MTNTMTATNTFVENFSVVPITIEKVEEKTQMRTNCFKIFAADKVSIEKRGNKMYHTIHYNIPIAMGNDFDEMEQYFDQLCMRKVDQNIWYPYMIFICDYEILTATDHILFNITHNFKYLGQECETEPYIYLKEFYIDDNISGSFRTDYSRKSYELEETGHQSSIFVTYEDKVNMIRRVQKAIEEQHEFKLICKTLLNKDNQIERLVVDSTHYGRILRSGCSGVKIGRRIL